MFKKLILMSTLLVVTSLFIACSDKENNADKTTAKKVEGRWYTSAQSIRGKKVFKANCALCHGDNGQGLVSDWKKAQSDGKFPAPPLNGSAHTWHHSKELLLRTVNNGGIPLGGTMPAFKDMLNNMEKEAVLAHIMSLWSNEVYNAWIKRNPR